MSEVHTLSVVVPVYRGETCLDQLVDAIAPMIHELETPEGRRLRVSELVLVHDCGPDRSDEVIRALAEKHDWIRPVWLSRNFGQHAATLAGMSSSGGDWVLTLDEDSQHDPADVANMLDVALSAQADVVYGEPMNAPPHGVMRNMASRMAKRSLRWMTANRDAPRFSSFRLVLGEIARSVAAYAGSGVYLDVALSWVARRVATCPVTVATEVRPSGYGLRSLLSHYRRMVLTGGTRLLRVVSAVGVLFAILGFAFATVLIGLRIFGEIPVAGWTSVMVVALIGLGIILFAVGIVAEYVGVAVNMALGKPLYLMVADRGQGPLGREGSDQQ